MIMKRSNYIFLVVGPSGSGKTTLVGMLEQSCGLTVIESYTTRKPRYSGEKGHIFVSDEEFDQLTDLVGYTEYNNHRYAATAKQVENNDIYVIDPAGVAYFKEHYHGSKQVRVIGIWATEPARKKRMFLRGDPEEAIERRLEGDRAYFNTDICDVVFYNKSLQETYQAVSQYIFWNLCIKSKVKEDIIMPNAAYEW